MLTVVLFVVVLFVCSLFAVCSLFVLHFFSKALKVVESYKAEGLSADPKMLEEVT